MKSDVFFFITSIFVIILGIGFIIAFYYITKILKDIKYVSAKIKNESALISEDISQLRQNIKREGGKLKFWADFVSKIFKHHKKS